MQLRELPDGEEEHAVISIAEHEERIALAAVAEKVDEYTEQVAGNEKGLKDSPITLKVLRRDQDDLTAKVEDLASSIETLGKDIETLKAEVTELGTQLKRAGEDREKDIL